MLNLNDSEIAIGIELVKLASQITKDIQSHLVTKAITKGDKSPVTIADYAAQAVAGKLLSENIPGASLVGEENANLLMEDDQIAHLDQIVNFLSNEFPDITKEKLVGWINFGNAEPKGKFWVIDPIDGTKGFLSGRQYAVALALIVNNQVELGFLGCPNLSEGYKLDSSGKGSLLIAKRNQGTWCSTLFDENNTHTRLNVSDISNNTNARIMRSFEAGHTNVGQVDHISDIMGIQADPVRLDSQAKYSILAAGYGELIFRLISPNMPDYKEKIWDQAAGSIIVEEAGGRITDLDGKPLDFSQGITLANNRGVLASNSHLHEAALTAIKTVNA